MSMHKSLKQPHRDRDKSRAGNRRTLGQAWAADRKAGRVPSPASPRCPRTRGRAGNNAALERARIEAEREERFRHF